MNDLGNVNWHKFQKLCTPIFSPLHSLYIHILFPQLRPIQEGQIMFFQIFTLTLLYWNPKYNLEFLTVTSTHTDTQMPMITGIHSSPVPIHQYCPRLVQVWLEVMKKCAWIHPYTGSSK